MCTPLSLDSELLVLEPSELTVKPGVKYSQTLPLSKEMFFLYRLALDGKYTP